MIAATVFADLHQAGTLQFAQDILYRTLGDADISGNIAQSGLVIFGQANQYVAVVAE
ncbi:MAG TPA: hypothetical protein VJN01_08880 [Xanthomonadales bacterium]|nr:hypothetical protein [Xanthomonadales bacterium]